MIRPILHAASPEAVPREPRCRTGRRSSTGTSRRATLFGQAVAALAALALAGGANADDGKIRFTVTVRNTNTAQNFSRIVLVAHGPEFRLFEVGHAASEPLMQLAEDGDPNGFEHLPTVGNGLITVVGPNVPRGRTVTIDLPLGNAAAGVVSAAAMLTLTNDGFVAARDLVLPREIGRRARMPLYAYDAGSEANTESCADMPCAEHGRRATSGAEGAVSLHPGVRGGGDIPPHRAWHDQVLGWFEIARVE